MSLRPVKYTGRAEPTMDGAGVKLRRAFGGQNPEMFDPYLLFADFRNERPEDFEKGFPWHPHRGIETITYVLSGTVEHGDSLGNEGVLGAGDIQLMTAGSGIMHQEMLKGNEQGQMHGFQLWANLPSSQKMMAPAYQDVTSENLPEIIDDDGTRVKVIIGEFWGKTSPVNITAADPQYLDIFVPAGVRKTFQIDTYRRAFAYIFEGAGKFSEASDPAGVLVEKELNGKDINIRDLSGNRTVIQFGTGDEVTVQAGPEGIRFLLISGAPMNEPIAWHGPIVMNTRDELIQAVNDLNNGTFIKSAS